MSADAPAPRKAPQQPAPCVGLRLGSRVSGEKFLHGVAAQEFAVPAGARVQVRRLRPDGPGDSPTHVLVVAPPDPRLSADQLEAACRDAAWHRLDARDEKEPHP